MSLHIGMILTVSFIGSLLFKLGGLLMNPTDLTNFWAFPSILLGIYLIATFIPVLAITARRLHDTNRSGWYLFLVLVPFIGTALVLVALTRPRE